MISSGKANFTAVSVFACIALIISTNLKGAAREDSDIGKVKTWLKSGLCLGGKND